MSKRHSNPYAERPWLLSYPPGFATSLNVSSRPINSLYEDAARDFPSRVCLSVGARHLRYAEAMRLIDRMSAGLQQMGIRHGERVAVCLPNCVAFPLIVNAIWKIGAVAVCMNPLYGEQMHAHQIEDSGAKRVVVLETPEMRARFEPILARLGGMVICARPDGSDIFDYAGSERAPHGTLLALMASGAEPTPVAIDVDRDLAVIQYTGGTTGTPKGAAHTHANLYISNQQMRWNVPQLIRGEVATATSAPLSHIGALQAGMNLVAALAGRLILLPRFDAQEFIDLIETERLNYFPGVPTMLIAMLNAPRIRIADLSSLRAVTNGAAPPPVEVQRAFQELTGVVIQPTYGLTETSMCAAGPITGRPDFASTGVPLVDTHIEIRSVNDPGQPVPYGEIGEVCVGGPQVMVGYWNKPAENAIVKVDGMVRTGDLGKMDERGFLYIVDRLKDMIICSGFNVYPTAVEDAIYGHPAVAECIVVGIPDEYRGETVKAYVVLRDGANLTFDELQAYLRNRLSPMEIPKSLEVRTSLPKTAVAKLSRKMLREEVLAVLQRPTD